MTIRLLAGRAVFPLMLLACCATAALAQEKPSGAELPRPAEIPDVAPDVLLRTGLPNVPGKVLIVSRTTYKPGAHVTKHYHTSQIVFYILQGAMGVRDEGKEAVTLKAGDTLLIKPGTVHEHWNASASEPLVFLEYVLVDEGQRSAIFVK
ncbi:MAG TPA: cupin domain-containing protein [Xanthobacteraceae bacterium]|nr:cupin domain-containing protein [Xanthobacteraceae bacterium]